VPARTGALCLLDALPAAGSDGMGVSLPGGRGNEGEKQHRVIARFTRSTHLGNANGQAGMN
jgi:hypothetical protein